MISLKMLTLFIKNMAKSRWIQSTEFRICFMILTDALNLVFVAPICKIYKPENLTSLFLNFSNSFIHCC
jgi:hypothetical protein